MKKTQKRAFILNECKSPYISQAIFILKDGITSNHLGVIADAERIVASYMSDVNNESITKKNRFQTPLNTLFTALITAALTAAIFIYTAK